MMRRGPQLVFAVAALLAGLLGVTPAVASAEDPEAYARVVVDSADLRAGPGVSFRVIYTARRGDALPLDGRASSSGYWLRVILPDGRRAYALGGDLQTFAVDPRDQGAPSRWRLFAPSPLLEAHVGLYLGGGVALFPVADTGMQPYGYMEARPSVVLHKTVTLDGFVGEVLTSDGSELFYGGGASVYITPSWPVCPFLELGGGGLSVLPNSDTSLLRRSDDFLLRAGGGLLVSLRGRLLLRFDATNMTIFDSGSYRNAQTFAGGLGVYY